MLLVGLSNDSHSLIPFLNQSLLRLLVHQDLTILEGLFLYIEGFVLRNLLLYVRDTLKLVSWDLKIASLL